MKSARGESSNPIAVSSSGSQSARGPANPQSSFLPALRGQPPKNSSVYNTNNQAGVAVSARGASQGPGSRSRSQHRGGGKTAKGGGNSMPVVMNTPERSRPPQGGVGPAGSRVHNIQELGATTLEEAAILMLERNKEAMTKHHPTEALVLLLHAQELGMHFACGEPTTPAGSPPSTATASPPAGSPTRQATTPIHEMMLLNAMTSHNLRTILIKMADWSQAFKTGLKATDLDQQLLERAVANFNKNSANQRQGGVGMITRQNPRDQRTVFGATMALASSHLQVSTVQSKLGRHQPSLVAAKNCVDTLTHFIENVVGEASGGAEGICLELAAIHSNNHTANGGGGPKAGSMEDHPIILLAAAQYNLSVELEHCNDMSAAVSVMARAVRYAAMSMPVDHPLRLRISQAAAGQQTTQQRQPRRPPGRPSTTDDSTGSSVGGFRSKTSHGSLHMLRSNSQGGGSQLGEQPLPPKNLPKLELSSIAVIPDLSGGSGGMVPLYSRKNPEEKVLSQQATTPAGGGGTSLDVTAALRDQRRLSSQLNSGTVAAASSRPPLTSSAGHHQHHEPQQSRNGSRPRPHDGGDQQSPANLKVAELKQQYQMWLTVATDTVFTDYSHRHHAALRIQCAWRSSKAKIETHNRRQILYHFLHQEQVAALRCIVGNMQARILHRKFKEGRVRRQLEAEERASREASQRKAVTKVVYFLRTAIARRRRNTDIMRRLELEHEEKLKQYDTAAVIIQRWWPIITQEKCYWRRRTIEMADLKAIAAEKQKCAVAATDIARTWRGREGRKHAKNYRREKLAAEAKKRRVVSESIDCIRTLLREHRHRQIRLALQANRKEQDETSAVAKIETEWQQCLERRAMKFINGRARLMQQSAAICQRCYRRYRARRDLRVLRIMTRTLDDVRLEKEAKRDKCALQIQCWYRICKAKNMRRFLLAGVGWRKISALWTIQRVGRGHEGRRYVALAGQFSNQLYRQALEAANQKRHVMLSRIQANLRAIQSEKVNQRLVHGEEWEELYIYHRMQYERTRDMAATKIQTQVRRRQGVVKADRRRNLIHDQMTYVQRQTVKLQCFWRIILAKRYLQRKQVEAMKAKDKKREFELVQNELFSWRAKELDGLQAVQRATMEDKEDQSWAYLLAFSMAVPVPQVVSSNTGEDGAPDGAPDGDDGLPLLAERNTSSVRYIDRLADDSSDEEEEGIYD